MKRRQVKKQKLYDCQSRGNLVKERSASWKSGWREIGGINKYYRSRWEANYARVLEYMKSVGEIALWEHEPTTFWFEGIKRGCRSYLPDFRVTRLDGSIYFAEIKGWVDARSITKLKRMKKYHPSIELVVLYTKEYKNIEKVYSKLITGWEEAAALKKTTPKL